MPELTGKDLTIWNKLSAWVRGGGTEVQRREVDETDSFSLIIHWLWSGMTVVVKNLAQTSFGLNAFTDVYTVPAATSAVLSGIILSNRSEEKGCHYYLELVKSGEADNNAASYLAWKVFLDAKETQTIAKGVTMGTGDKISVYSNDCDTVAITVSGVEIT